MFPDAHAKPVSNVSVKLLTQFFHTTYFKIVYPSSDKLINFLYLVAVANAPATASEFFHSLLELHN